MTFSILGLDPAGPAFYIEGIFGRELDREDAIFVDIIHTSWGSYGIAKKLGHVEFFPNRGDTLLQTQPFCDAVVFTLRPIRKFETVFYTFYLLKQWDLPINHILFEFCRGLQPQHGPPFLRNVNPSGLPSLPKHQL